MSNLISIVQWLVGNWSGLLNSIIAILTALVVFFMLIPGDQPEKALQAIVNFIKKFSLK